MTERKGRGKRLVSIQEDLVRSVTEASRDEGKSVGKFVEEALRQVLRTNSLGFSPERVAELVEVVHANRILGGVFMPQEVFNYLVERVCKADKEQLRAKWYESGVWYGKYLKEKFENPVQNFKSFLEATRWDLSEVEVEQEGDGVKLRCISTVLTAEGTELLAKLVEGVMHGIGYETEKSDCVKGMIVLELKKVSST